MKFLLVLVAAAPLMAQCSYTVNPRTFNLPAGGAAGVVTGVANVTAGENCLWQAKVSAEAADWITIYQGQTGQGNGIVGISLARNPINAARTGTLTIAGLTVTVNQAAQVCGYSLSPGAVNMPLGGGDGSAQVSASCVWSAGSSDGNWIIVTAGSQGTFDGRVNFTVSPNSCVSARSGSVGVGLPGSPAAAQVSITQDGSPNNLSLSPGVANIGPDAADGKFSVIIGASCPWSAFSDVSWLTISSNTSGNGVGTVQYRAAANPSPQRAGNIHVGPQIFTVVQQAAAAPPMVLTAVANAASGAPGVVSPGEIVSLFGSNLGPATGVRMEVTADGKSITKALGGVEVLFDGTPAALTYASAGQINAVVPFGVKYQPNTEVKVQYQGASSNALRVAVQSGAPGIFTQDGSGLGAGAILNQDFSVNGNANRAARGSTVQIFLTGAGVTDPPSPDGWITTGVPPRLTERVEVLIAGAVCQIQYAGAAPGGIAGFTQINAVVPDVVAPGPSVPVQVGIGSWSSQPGVTLAVK